MKVEGGLCGKKEGVVGGKQISIEYNAAANIIKVHYMHV
jgi:hypothetical protein